METANGEAPGSETQLSDIQNYLATFNKEISSNGTPTAQFLLQNAAQAGIIQAGDGVDKVPGMMAVPQPITVTADSTGIVVESMASMLEEEDNARAVKIEGGEPSEVVQVVHGQVSSDVRAVQLVSGHSTSHHTTAAQLMMANSGHLDGGKVVSPLLTIQPSMALTAVQSSGLQVVSGHDSQFVAMQAGHDGSAPQIVAIPGPGGQQAQIITMSTDDGHHGGGAQTQFLTVQATGSSQPQLIALSDQSGTTAQPQFVAVQQSPGSSQPQVVTFQGGLDTSPGGDGTHNQQGAESSVVVNTGPGGSYQTVTIVPSDVNQGGEVSYVLIVSQPEPEQVKGEGTSHNASMDMGVYDFKEEDRGEIIGDDGEKKMIRVTTKKVSHGNQSQLMCNYCNYTSPKRYLLTRHMKTHSEERPHKCNICDRGFKTVASLQNHINTHTGVRPHKCKECESAFTTSGELVRHVRYRHTFEKPHKCTECDYASVELSKLKRHIRSHTGERPYQCPHCTYASPDTYKLKRHLRIHTGEKPYECDVCQARFTQSNSLKAHKLIHSGNKPVYQCELCPTTCGRKTDLKIHVMKLHTSEKPLQCKKCGKSFPDRYTYKIHTKTHEGEKCYKCELCPYAALSQRHLESHILTHTGEKPWSCDECDQAFRQKQLLKRHKNLYHTPDYVPPPPKEKTHECSECGKGFAHRGNLLRHLAVHDPEHPSHHEVLQEEEQGLGDEELDGDESYEDEEMLEAHEVDMEGDDSIDGQTPTTINLITAQGVMRLSMAGGQNAQVITKTEDGDSDPHPVQLVMAQQDQVNYLQEEEEEVDEEKEEEQEEEQEEEEEQPQYLTVDAGVQADHIIDITPIISTPKKPGRRGRPSKIDDSQVLDDEEGTPRKRGRASPAANVVLEEVEQADEMAEEDEDDQELEKNEEEEESFELEDEEESQRKSSPRKKDESSTPSKRGRKGGKKKKVPTATLR